ncbi:hypothetical protein GDO86_004427 [Hymenochirus boettgeri]|uniref:Integrin alpha-2 domain-containing protein n=1 Tax=Hymenochirus boettgeri TaxID=247094 RepID=A0A8T2K8Q8_9PIPI|nr:hypothetical protein GDO86_004427 [Hymenochirus boettgeri]
MASYFGYSVSATDLNRDGLDDLLIGAPLFMDRTHDGRIQEVGRVYVYLQGYGMEATPKIILTGTEEYGRFGSSIAALGDLDQDGFNDVAVGAPFGGENQKGAVFIFNGQSGGINPKPSQVLQGEWGSSQKPAFFGSSTRGGHDLDGNGYPVGLVSKVSVFADDTKLCRPLKTSEDVQSLQGDLDRLSHWAAKWQMKFNPCGTYTINGSVLSESLSERDLGVLVDNKLKGSKQCQVATAIASMVLSCIKRGMDSREENEESEFRDKLSPIYVGLNFSLDPLAPVDAHGLMPIFDYKTKNFIEQKAQIQLDCGEDNICVPDLKLNVSSDRKSVYLGDDNPLTLFFNALNLGGGAYEAELYVTLPPEAQYSGIVRKQENLLILPCAYEVVNETRLVICDLGNPMKSGANLSGGLRFTLPHLRDSSPKVQFDFQIRSKNENNSQSETVHFAVNVEVSSTVSFLGASKPDSVIFPVANWKSGRRHVTAQEAGPEVKHVYELVNFGPSSVSHGILELRCPMTVNRDYAMYVMSYSMQGLNNCTSNHPVNPFHLQQSPTAHPPTQIPNTVHHVEKRDTARLVSGGSNMLKCNEPRVDCFHLQCNIGLLEKLKRAIVEVQFIIWADTFMQKENQGFTLQCQVDFHIQRVPYKILPHKYPKGTYQVDTAVHWTKPESSYGVPLWIIILAILIGLLLLALLIYVLYKLGFFKRSLPYGTAMEKAELKPQAASEA